MATRTEEAMQRQHGQVWERVKRREERGSGEALGFAGCLARPYPTREPWDGRHASIRGHGDQMRATVSSEQEGRRRHDWAGPIVHYGRRAQSNR